MAKLVARTKEPAKASVLWDRFFRSLEREPEPEFMAEKPGALIHAFLELQLRDGKHHQRLLEHVTSPQRLEHLQSVHDWMLDKFDEG